MTFPDEIDWTCEALREAEQAALLFTGLAFEEIVRFATGSLCYLATPYSREVVDRNGEWSFHRSVYASEQAADWMAVLAFNGVQAVSPIVMAHAMIKAKPGHLVPLDDAFWARWCSPLLQACNTVIVPNLPGWTRSTGIWREVTAALSRNRTVLLPSGVR